MDGGYSESRWTPVCRHHRQMEKTYGVKIQIQTAELPQIDVIRGKIPVNMGLDYALRALQKITPFQYEKDENNVIHIK